MGYLNSILEFIDNQSSLSIAILFAGVIVIIYVLPNSVRRMGINRIGPLEMEHQNQSHNHEVVKRIEEIDIDNRENLWDMTEDMFSIIADQSMVKCPAVVGYIVSEAASPLRTLVLLNHIAPKLSVNNEERLSSKIRISLLKAVRDSKGICSIKGCPVWDDVQNIQSSKYNVMITDWIMRARSITARACKDKISVYRIYKDMTSDKFWKGVYSQCIEKNESYIKGMGYNIKDI